MAQRAKNINNISCNIRVANFDGAVKKLTDKLTVIRGSRYAGKDKAGQPVYTDVEVKVFTGDKGTDLSKMPAPPAKGQDIVVTGQIGQVSTFQKKDGSVVATLEVLANAIAPAEMEEVPDAPAAQADGNPWAAAGAAQGWT